MEEREDRVIKTSCLCNALFAVLLFRKGMDKGNQGGEVGLERESGGFFWELVKLDGQLN